MPARRSWKGGLGDRRATSQRGSRPVPKVVGTMLSATTSLPASPRAASSTSTTMLKPPRLAAAGWTGPGPARSSGRCGPRSRRGVGPAGTTRQRQRRRRRRTAATGWAGHSGRRRHAPARWGLDASPRRAQRGAGWRQVRSSRTRARSAADFDAPAPAARSARAQTSEPCLRAPTHVGHCSRAGERPPRALVRAPAPGLEPGTLRLTVGPGRVRIHPQPYIAAGQRGV